MDILSIILLSTIIPISLMYIVRKYREFRFPPYIAHYVDGTIADDVDYSKPLHRVDGPAVVIKKHREEYWINGIQHRWDGPAVISYGLGGVNQYFINGTQISRKMFHKVRYADRDQVAQYLISPRQEIRELAEYRAKEFYD